MTASISVAQTATSHAVAIGVHTYSNDPIATRLLPFADHDATAFARVLSTARKSEFPLRNVSLLRDDAAALDTVRSELTRAIAGAQDGAVVYVFMSVRGYAGPGWKDGFIGTSGLVSGKPQSTALRISRFKDLITLSRASNIVFLLDVCREPTGTNNRINQRIEEELGSLPRVSGVLASEPRKTSKEQADLTHGEQQGFGVFAYHLVTGMESGGQPRSGRRLLADELAALFTELERRIAGSTNRQQVPRLLGGQRQARLLRYPETLATALFVPGLLAMQNAATQGVDTPGWLPPFASASEELDPDAAVEQFDALPRSQYPSAVLDSWRDHLAARLADQGQRVVARYGAGDQFPEDPEKLQRSDFEFAARCFRGALRLVPENDRIWISYRQSLEARRLFCLGRALAFEESGLPEARKILSQARTIEQPPIPEIDNTLGITYLEFRRDPADINEAIRYFREAKRQAPGWAYPRHNLALAYVEKGDYNSAQREYKEAIEAAPDYPFVHYNLGLVLHRLNRTPEAAEAYRGALRAFEGVLTAEQAIQEDARARGDAQRIARSVTRAEVFTKNTAEVYNSLGVLYAAQNFSAAADNYKHALSANPRLAPARHNLGLLLKSEAGPDRISDAAAKLFAENLVVAPDFNPSRLELAKLYSAKGSHEEARLQFVELIHRAPTSTEGLVGLARLLSAQGKHSQAADVLARGIKEQIAVKAAGASDSSALAVPELYVALADVYAAGKDSRACEQLATAVKAAESSVYSGNKAELRKRARRCRTQEPGKRPEA